MEMRVCFFYNTFCKIYITMQYQYKITVVIPFFKRVDFAHQAIQSILAQNYDLNQVQIILSDEDRKGSNRKEFESKYKNIIYTINQLEHCSGSNRQSAWSLALGEYITFLDVDDRMAPDFLSKMSRVLDSDKKCSAAICLSRYTFESGYSIKKKIKLLPLFFIREFLLLFAFIFNRGYIFPSLFYLCQISHVMFKAERIKGQVFSYDYHRGGEDWDFFIQTIQKDPIRIVPSKSLYYRYSIGSNTNLPINQKLKWQSYLLLISRLPENIKKGLLCKLFLYYIKLYGGNYVSKK